MPLCNGWNERAVDDFVNFLQHWTEARDGGDMVRQLVLDPGATNAPHATCGCNNATWRGLEAAGPISQPGVRLRRISFAL